MITGITEALLEQYYDNAVIHIAWLTKKERAGISRRLVFGMVEAYPKELNIFPVLKEQEKKYKNGRLYYVRIQRTIRQAVSMYRSIMERGVIPYDWDDTNLKTPVTKQKNSEIRCGAPAEPSAPFPRCRFTLSDQQHMNTPFIADIWGKANIHQVLCRNPAPALTDFMQHEKPGEWLEQFLGWNISFYQELVGSAHFILPNPYYSDCHICLIPSEKGPDKVKLDFQLRRGADVSKLVIAPFEKTHFGLTAIEETRMKQASCVIDLTGKAEKFGMYLRSDEFGLIDQKDFSSFVRGYVIDLYAGSVKKRIHRPDTGEIYEVEQYEHVTSIHSDTDENPMGRRLSDAEIQRRRMLDANAQGLSFFYQNHKEAERFIRSLIQQARHSVLIADPYFAANELFAYVEAVRYRDVKVKLITSADYLKTKSKRDIYDSTPPELGEELFQQCTARGGDIEITVLTGKRPAIHDRFILMDDEAWFSGGSLNTVGDRLSCIVKLADSRELKERIKAIQNSDRAVPLKEWLEKRRKNKPDKPENTQPGH